MKMTKNPYQEAISHTGTCKLGGNINSSCIASSSSPKAQPRVLYPLKPTLPPLLAGYEPPEGAYIRKEDSSIDSDVSDDSRYEAF